MLCLISHEGVPVFVSFNILFKMKCLTRRAVLRLRKDLSFMSYPKEQKL